ncbi:hypothetical protein KOAAANKH_01689 [Brevundimonas sp. NIBR10]|uniref:hypothetical protein n=1 Tax=Brevundimonas sp. NIBR10 TaxID=3015997 RepID=UPI0022F1B49E|nr:hypothetical protein [Brevundimonas sp. NIBR10]WGM46815.1 hypothetical protein KOAAANKH_01689 [Brevundimonas sp. NIBR10]
MQDVLIPQDVYDRLLMRLLQNHVGHKKLSDFALVKQMVEKHTRTTLDGPYVRADILEIAEDSLQKNIKLAGDRYQTAPDRLLLFSIKEAREATASPSAPEPVQSLQQHDVGEPSSPEPDATPDVAQTAEAEETVKSHTYKGHGRIADRINGASPSAPKPDPRNTEIAALKESLGPPPEGTMWMFDGFDSFDAVPILLELPDLN